MSGNEIPWKYKNSLKLWIKKRGYKLYEVADAIGIGIRTLNDHCAGRVPIPRKILEKIAELIDCPVSYLEEDANTFSDAALESDDMDKRRRELLRLMNTAAAILAVPAPTIDWARIEVALVKPFQLDEMTLCDLAAINSHLWRIYCASSFKSILFDGVLGQLKTLITFLRDRHPTQVHKQLCALISDLSQLTGELFFDINDYNTAQSCYTFAAAAAKEAEHYDLWACVLIRHGFLPIYNAEYHDALPLLQEAWRLSLRGDTMLVTRFWAAAVEAEAQSGARNLSACQAALDRATEVDILKGGANGAWLRFDGSRLPEQRGACFVRLKKPKLALPALEEALRQLPTPVRRRGMVLTDLALASLQQREVEQACKYGAEAVEIALTTASGWLRKSIYTLRTQLHPFAEVDSVKQLDRHILDLRDANRKREE